MYREITNQATVAVKTAVTGVSARRDTVPGARALANSSIVRPISAIVNTTLTAVFSAVPITASPPTRALRGQRVPQSLNEPAPGNVGDRAKTRLHNTAVLSA